MKRNGNRTRKTDAPVVRELKGDPLHCQLTAMVAAAALRFWKARGIDEREFTRIHQWKAR